MFARVAIYRFKPGLAESIYAKTEAELLPLFREQPGFHSYEVIRTGPDSCISTSIWLTESHAQEAARLGAKWIRENLFGQIETSETYVGAVVFSHV